MLSAHLEGMLTSFGKYNLYRPIYEIYCIVYVDEIWISRQYIVRVVCTEKHTLNLKLARRENSESLRRLLSTFAPPDMVVCNSGTEFRFAYSQVGRRTRIQRFLFHVLAQDKQYLQVVLKWQLDCN